MSNADILIAWPNLPLVAGVPSWSLSHREATGHVPPVDTSNSPDTSTTTFFTLLPSLSTSDPDSPYTAVSWLRLLARPDHYPSTSSYADFGKSAINFVYASSSIRPGSAAENAPIAKHDQARLLFLLRYVPLCKSLTDPRIGIRYHSPTRAFLLTSAFQRRLNKSQCRRGAVARLAEWPGAVKHGLYLLRETEPGCRSRNAIWSLLPTRQLAPSPSCSSLPSPFSPPGTFATFPGSASTHPFNLARIR